MGRRTSLLLRPGVRTCAAVGVIVAYYLFRFRDSLLTFFALDDFWILEAAARIGGTSDVARILLPDQGAFVLYRPFTQVGYFYLLRCLFDHDASGYHAVQLAAHVANALLVFGIARRLTASTLGSLAAALFYAAAPGHIVAIYWLAAYAMTGSTLIVLATVYLWLRTDGIARVVGCTLLQVVGLLSSEHTVVAPALIAIVSVLGPMPERPARVARQLAAPVALVAAYLAVKVWYLKFSKALVVFSGYAVDVDPARWLAHLARYGAACINALTLLPVPESSLGSPLVVAGAAIVGLTALSAWRVLCGHDRWRLLAVGSATFVTSLLPVLPLRDHYFDYFVGTAAMGAALALLGLCRLVTASWAPLAASCVALLLLLDAVTGGTAARSNKVYALVLGSGAGSAGWVRAARRAADAGATEVVVKRDIATEQVFVVGRARDLFGLPVPLSFYAPGPPPRGAPGVAVLGRASPVPAGEPLPGWQPWLAPLRRLAGAPSSVVNAGAPW